MTGLTENQAEFLHWARRIADAIDLDQVEYHWKMETARELSAARDVMLSEADGWREVLHRALGKAAGLLNPFLMMSLKDWLRDDPDAFRAALLPVWSPEIPSISAIDTLT